jgi:hypothetical protein
VNGRRGTQGREGAILALQRVVLEGLSGNVVAFYFFQPVPGRPSPKIRKVRWRGLRDGRAIYAHVQRLLVELAADRPVPPAPP